MATNERCSGLHECDGVFDYSAHHHYIVVLPHYHDRYTALRRTVGKHELYGVKKITILLVYCHEVYNFEELVCLLVDG